VGATVLAGLIVGIGGQLGDLTLSMIKRTSA
jgi:CDP-diglyceride synthetase